MQRLRARRRGTYAQRTLPGTQTYDSFAPLGPQERRSLSGFRRRESGLKLTPSTIDATLAGCDCPSTAYPVIRYLPGLSC